jgi:DNA-binding CsgD family transcriptional regulator
VATQGGGMDMLGYNLTDRERDTFNLVSKGMTNSEIADMLKISNGTVKKYVSRLLRKFDVSSRQELAAFYSSEKHIRTDKTTDAFVGLWVSKFTYTRASGEKGEQYDVEKIWRSVGKYHGENIVALDGERAYLHELDFSVEQRMLRGTWTNTNTFNLGVFQLIVSSSKKTMRGKHLGNDNVVSVREGDWDWVKLQTDKKTEVLLENRDPKALATLHEQLKSKFEECVVQDVPFHFYTESRCLSI